MTELDYEKIGKQYVSYVIMLQQVEDYVYRDDDELDKLHWTTNDDGSKSIDWSKMRMVKDKPLDIQEATFVADKLRDEPMPWCLDYNETKEIWNIIKQLLELCVK